MNILENINYNAVHDILNNDRKFSLSYLKDAIERNV